MSGDRSTADDRLMSFIGGRDHLRDASGSRFSLTMMGDCCPSDSIIEALRQGRANDIVAAAKPYVAESDIRIMQWETPISETATPIVKSGPNLRCPPVSMEVMKALGVDIALLANNHIGDHGAEAVLETMLHIEKSGVRTVGAGATLQDAGRPLVSEAGDLRLAILNFAENEFGIASASKPGVAPLDPAENIRGIRQAASEADVVLVVIHGGHEHYALPSPRMVETYRSFVEAGAAAVINCHTHCPGGVELWQGAPIIYSVGNFFFPKDLPPDSMSAAARHPLWWYGYVPKLFFDKRGVYAIEIMPFKFDRERVLRLNSNESKGFWDYLATLNRIIADKMEVKRSFEAWVAKQGPVYLDWMRESLSDWPMPTEIAKSSGKMMLLRNILVCEAHRDIVACYMRLLEEGRVEASIEGWPHIAALQRPDWVEAGGKGLPVQSI